MLICTRDRISSTLIENSVQFLKLHDQYKSDLLEDSCLTKAAGLAAQQELLLDDDEHNLAVGPLQLFKGNIAKIQKGIKRKAISASLQTPITPAIKRSPKAPESRKIPKFSFKTGSKGKRLFPKTPKKTSSSSKHRAFSEPYPLGSPASVLFASGYSTEP